MGVLESSVFPFLVGEVCDLTFQSDGETVCRRLVAYGDSFSSDNCPLLFSSPKLMMVF
jgi:hypothetical protein